MIEEQAKLHIRVYSGSSKNMITGYKDDILNIKITTRPEKGKANETLIKFLSDRLSIAKSRITISKGITSRNKIVLIQGMSTQDAISCLTGLFERKDSA